MRNRTKNNSGFTLIEIALIVAAAGFICVVGYIAFSHHDETAAEIIQ